MALIFCVLGFYGVQLNKSSILASLGQSKDPWKIIAVESNKTRKRVSVLEGGKNKKRRKCQNVEINDFPKGGVKVQLPTLEFPFENVSGFCLFSLFSLWIM